MRASLRERALPVLGLLAATTAGPFAVLHFFGGRQVAVDGGVHFYGLALSSAVATAAAVAMTYVGARRGDGRAVLVGTAFSAMAAMLAVHGFTTPDFLVGMNGVVAFSGAATLPLGGAVLALSALPTLRRPRSVRPLLWLQGVLLVAILGLGALGVLVPEFVPAVPEDNSPEAIALLVVGLLFFLALGLRAARTYLLTRRRADLAVVAGIVLLAAAIVPALTLGPSDLGWWAGHAWELMGIALVGAPVALDLHRGAQSRPLAGDLSGAELVRAADSFLGPAVRALLVRLAEKDAYTEGHTRRVALLAVQVGDELGLPPSRLRELAIGGLLHDVGKLSVPDAILQKPGPLSDDEYEVIRRHPGRGAELVEELGGFSPLVVRLVRDHHERLDGNGYPAGSRAECLDLETRVLTACDVYDALRSARVYRDAWSRGRALKLLREESGSAFDPRCVEALERVLAGPTEAPSVSAPTVAV
jgi:HD-GYP domain-containing protein (c-di-GMP phosphodiesterase class II)